MTGDPEVETSYGPVPLEWFEEWRQEHPDWTTNEIGSFYARLQAPHGTEFGTCPDPSEAVAD